MNQRHDTSAHALRDDIGRHYDHGFEQARLSQGASRLEFARTQEVIERYLPRQGSVVLDVGGGPGAYALWLASKGHEVHLIDLMPLHVQQAKAASDAQAEFKLASCAVGDARNLDRPDSSVDAVLMLGPLYHLIERNDRLQAWREAGRVLRPGGVVIAAAISRYASMLDGLSRMLVDDPKFVEIMRLDLDDGRHLNPENHPDYFATAYFHEPSELEAEIRDAGGALRHQATLAVEGPAWLMQSFEQHWSTAVRRERLLEILRSVETAPSLLGASAHLIAVARKLR